MPVTFAYVFPAGTFNTNATMRNHRGAITSARVGKHQIDKREAKEVELNLVNVLT